MTRALSSLLALALVACDGPMEVSDAGMTDGGPVDAPRCDDTDSTHCLLPWPSDHFRQDGRIALPPTGTPATTRGLHVDPAPFAREGFSLLPTLMTVMTPTPHESSLFGEEQIAASLGPDATTVLVDIATGERVPCFAEIDRWPDVDPERTPLYIRPAQRLDPSTRYAVGIRGLRTASGELIEPSPYFRALRDETSLEGTEVETRHGDLDDVFAALERAGFARDELQLAWGFTTASEASIVSDLLAMRDGMRAADSACTVTSIEDRDAGDELPDELWRRIRGTIAVPLYLVGVDPASPEASRIARDGEGRPVSTETVEVPFTALLPESLRARVAAGGEPGRALVYGHGILGSQGEANSPWMHSQAFELEAAVFATDWWGMSMEDLARLVVALTRDFSTFEATPERLHQGVLNVLALTRAVRESCAPLPELSVPRDDDTLAPAYDPSQVHFYGNSLGAIMGAVVTGVAPELERAVLGVGGAGWPMLMKRSDAWRTFDGLLATTYEDPVERALLIAMSGMLWAPVDGITYAPRILRDPLDGSIARRILLQIGIGDVAVSNATAHVFARSAGLPLTVPSLQEPFGLQTVDPDAETVDSALTIYGIAGVDPLPPGSRDPGPDTPTHNALRNLPSVRAQIDAFLQPEGRVIHPCVGPCDPD